VGRAVEVLPALFLGSWLGQSSHSSPSSAQNTARQEAFSWSGFLTQFTIDNLWRTGGANGSSRPPGNHSHGAKHWLFEVDV